MMHLNTNCNVAHLAEYLFVNFPSLIINKKCYHCNYENLQKVLIININMFLENGLSAFQNANNRDKDSMCKECHQSVLEKYDFQSHLLVDCNVFTDERYAASIFGIQRKSMILGSISKVLNM